MRDIFRSGGFKWERSISCLFTWWNKKYSLGLEWIWYDVWYQVFYDHSSSQDRAQLEQELRAKINVQNTAIANWAHLYKHDLCSIYATNPRQIIGIPCHFSLSGRSLPEYLILTLNLKILSLNKNYNSLQWYTLKTYYDWSRIKSCIIFHNLLRIIWF